MKKITTLLSIIVILTALVVSPTQAGSPMVHYDLIPHTLVPSEAWGRITYNESGESMDFVLTAHNLEPNTLYTLNTFGVIGLGTGISNPAGNLTIEGSWDCTHDLVDARLNLRRVYDYEWTLWTGVDHLETIFTCTN